MEQLKKDLYNLRFVLPILFIYFLVTQMIFKTVCIFKIIFHHDCPGCGLTRACLCILTGQFTKSLEYNPSAIFWLISIFLLLIHRYVKRFKYEIFPYVFIVPCIITLVVFLIR